MPKLCSIIGLASFVPDVQFKEHMNFLEYIVFELFPGNMRSARERAETVWS